MNRENNNNNRERNPFQRNSERRNEYPRANGSGGYRDWKNRNPHPLQPQPILPPKEKVLTADDFPALGSAAAAPAAKPKSAWALPEVTIADRVKDAIAKEEERRIKGEVEEKEDEKLDVIPLSSWMRSSYLAKKRVEDERRRAAEEEEENYRWQISRAIVRRDPREEMEREFELQEAEADADDEEEFVDDTPQYEREDRR